MENKTMKELKVIAKELGVKNWWILKKADLIEGIKEKQSMTPEEQQAEAEQKAREYAAMKVYDADWRKFTKRYNPVEFIEKFRSGEIKITDEECVAADNTPEEPTEEKKEEKPVEKLVKDKKSAPAVTPTPGRGALIEFDGKSQNICKWGEELGISPNTLYGRIYKMGWTVERAFTTPGKKK